MTGGSERSQIENGKPGGPWVSYYQNGQLFWEGGFKDGKEEGPCVWYTEDGTKNNEGSGTYRDGVKVSD